jgi:hypothetical protein
MKNVAERTKAPITVRSVRISHGMNVFGARYFSYKANATTRDIPITTKLMKRADLKPAAWYEYKLKDSRKRAKPEARIKMPKRSNSMA